MKPFEKWERRWGSEQRCAFSKELVQRSKRDRERRKEKYRERERERRRERERERRREREREKYEREIPVLGLGKRWPTFAAVAAKIPRFVFPVSKSFSPFTYSNIARRDFTIFFFYLFSFLFIDFFSINKHTCICIYELIINASCLLSPDRTAARQLRKATLRWMVQQSRSPWMGISR